MNLKHLAYDWLVAVVLHACDFDLELACALIGEPGRTIE